MISTQMAAEIINCAFKTEFCMFKVNKSEFNVTMAITSHPVEAFKKIPKHTQKQKQKQKEHFLKLCLKCFLRLNHADLGFPYEDLLITSEHLQNLNATFCFLKPS